VATEPFHSDKPGKAINEGQLRGNLWGWTNCVRSVSIQKAALLSGASTALRREGLPTATAAPRGMARRRRAKIGGAADLATSPISASVVATLSLPPRHHA